MVFWDPIFAERPKHPSIAEERSGLCGPSLGIKPECLSFFVVEKDTEFPDHAGYSNDYMKLLLYISQATSIRRSEESPA